MARVMNQLDRSGGFLFRGRWDIWGTAATWAALSLIAASVVCGVVGLFTITVAWQVGIFLGLFTDLAYVAFASRESNTVLAGIATSVGQGYPC
jgi:hypothetical protein